MKSKIKTGIIVGLFLAAMSVPALATATRTHGSAGAVGKSTSVVNRETRAVLPGTGQYATNWDKVVQDWTQNFVNSEPSWLKA
jgi:hypothetical protein